MSLQQSVHENLVHLAREILNNFGASLEIDINDEGLERSLLNNSMKKYSDDCMQLIISKEDREKEDHHQFAPLCNIEGTINDVLSFFFPEGLNSDQFKEKALWFHLYCSAGNRAPDSNEVFLNILMVTLA